MALDGIARRERDVVATLHHARAAGLAEQAFDRDRDVEVGFGAFDVQRCEQTGAAGTENQDVGVELVHDARVYFSAPMRARTSSRRDAAAASMSRCREPPCESIVTSSGPKPRMRNFQRHS